LAIPENGAADGRASECIRLTQRELGNAIGATRESVNKHLRAWQRKGWVRIADRLVVITDRAGLEVLSEPQG
jgi:CRP-like cAMP-binding protein